MADNFYSTQNLTPGDIAAMYGGIYAPAAPAAAPTFVNGLDTQRAVNAFYEGIISPPAPSGVGEPPRTRTVQSVPPPSPANPPGAMPAFSEIARLFSTPAQSAGVTRLANGVAGTVQLPRDVRPNVPEIPGITAPASVPARTMFAYDDFLREAQRQPDRLTPGNPQQPPAFAGVVDPYLLARNSQALGEDTLDLPMPRRRPGDYVPQRQMVAQAQQPDFSLPRRRPDQGGVTQPRQDAVSAIAQMYGRPAANRPLRIEVSSSARAAPRAAAYAPPPAAYPPLPMSPAQYAAATESQSYHPHTSHSFFDQPNR